ncbi:MAG: peptidylprolyl isomerase [Deltaproteobacteria bacterium]|nr:peptidylprolyl isomerase [Deltaproteobacteria bacterium]
MKWKRGLALCLATGIFFVCGTMIQAWAGETTSPKEKVAVVNGTVITRAELDQELRIVMQRFGRAGKTIGGPQLSQLEPQVLESLIGRELLFQEAKDAGIRIKEETVSTQLGKLKQRFSDEAAFKNAMTQMHLSEQEVRQQIRRGMTIQQWINGKFVKTISVPEKEVKDYYDANPKMFQRPEEVRASHILIKVDQKADEKTKVKARKELEEIQKKLLKGEDFAKLAKEYSQGPSATKGGDLGFFRRGQMVPPFEKVAFALKPGKVSDIVVTRFGYHLIKVTDWKPGKTFSYPEVKEKLAKFLKERKVSKAIDAHVQELKKGAKVERFLSPGKHS